MIERIAFNAILIGCLFGPVILGAWNTLQDGRAWAENQVERDYLWVVAWLNEP